MVLHNVDFIGGGFNMSAFSTVGDVFKDPEFVAPGNSLLWGLGGLDDTCRECTGFLTMPKRPNGESHGCNKYDNAELGFGPSDQTAHRAVCAGRDNDGWVFVARSKAGDLGKLLVSVGKVWKFSFPKGACETAEVRVLPPANSQVLL